MPPSSRRRLVAAIGAAVAVLGVVAALVGIEPWNACHLSATSCAVVPQQAALFAFAYPAIIVGAAVSAVELCLHGGDA